MIGDAQENQAAVTFGILPWRRQKVYEKTKALAHSNIYLLRGGAKKVTIRLQKQGGTKHGSTMEAPRRRPFGRAGFDHTRPCRPDRSGRTGAKCKRRLGGGGDQLCNPAGFFHPHREDADLDGGGGPAGRSGPDFRGRPRSALRHRQWPGPVCPRRGAGGAWRDCSAPVRGGQRRRSSAHLGRREHRCPAEACRGRAAPGKL